MMKRTLALMLGACLALSLTACGSSSENTSPDSSTAPLPPVSPEAPSVSEAPAAPETDYQAIYSDILANVHSILVDPASRTEFAPGEMGVFEAANVLGTEATDTVGYIFKDIDGNGVTELLVGVFEKPDFAYTRNELYAVYTCKENTPILLLEGTGRNTCSLMDNGSFFRSGSNGALYSIFGEFAISDDGTLESKSYYFTYEKNEAESGIGFYYNTTGVWDPAVSQELELQTEDEFWAIEQQLAARTVTLQNSKFAQLQPDV